MDVLLEFLQTTGVAQLSWGNVLMMVIGITFITLAITKHYEPLLLLPIGFGVLVGNIPHIKSMALGVYDETSVLYYLYFGVKQGIYPPLIFLGIGAMTDFSAMLSNPKLVLLGAAAQVGIFITLIGALFIGFDPNNQLVPAGVKLNTDGYVCTDEKCETSIDGIFAIGDLREKYARQIVVAAGDGCTAALAAAHFVEMRRSQTE